MGRLLRYELVLVRRSLADAFGRTSDRLLLLLLGLLGVLMAEHWLEQLRNLSLPPETAYLALLAVLLSWSWHRILLSRLERLTENSVVAADALSRSGRRTYLAAGQISLLLLLLPLLLLLAGATGQRAAPLALALLGQAAGAVAASAMPSVRTARRSVERDWSSPPPRSPRQAVLQCVLRFATLGAHRPGLAVLGLATGNFAATFALLLVAGEQADPVELAAAALPSLLVLLLAARLDSNLLAFLPAAGCGPGLAALSVSLLPAASFAAASAACLLAGSASVLIVLAALHFGLTLIAVARAWLYPGRSARSVHLQIQLELAALGLIAFTIPPLAPLLLIARLAMLWRRHARLRWIQH